MRISVEEDDPGYEHFTVTSRYEVYLNGELIKCALTADEEKGYVRAIKLDDAGNPTHSGGPEFDVGDYFGVVELRKVTE